MWTVEKILLQGIPAAKSFSFIDTDVERYIVK